MRTGERVRDERKLRDANGRENGRMDNVLLHGHALASGVT